jgi:hypothetical protein
MQSGLETNVGAISVEYTVSFARQPEGGRSDRSSISGIAEVEHLERGQQFCQHS